MSLVPRANAAEGSDYINATWLPGFVHLNEFIMTQHPMQQTVSDFWRMVWEHNVRTMVVLSPSQEDFHPFWPSRQVTLEADNLRIKLLEETGCNGLDMKDFNLSAVHDSYEVAVKVMFAPGWPLALPSSFGFRTLSDLVRFAHGTHKQASHYGEQKLHSCEMQALTLALSPTKASRLKSSS